MGICFSTIKEIERGGDQGTLNICCVCERRFSRQVPDLLQRCRAFLNLSESSPFFPKTSVWKPHSPSPMSQKRVLSTAKQLQMSIHPKKKLAKEQTEDTVNPPDCRDCCLLCVQSIKLPAVSFICCLYPSGKMCLYCDLKRQQMLNGSYQGVSAAHPHVCATKRSGGGGDVCV